MEVNLIPIILVHLGRKRFPETQVLVWNFQFPWCWKRLSLLTVSLLSSPLLSSPVQHSLTHPELTVAVEMLSSVALINRALESGDMNTVWKQLSSTVTGLTNIEEENCQRWDPSACALGPWRGASLCLLCLHACFHSFQALCLCFCCQCITLKAVKPVGVGVGIGARASYVMRQVPSPAWPSCLLLDESPASRVDLLISRNRN